MFGGVALEEGLKEGVAFFQLDTCLLLLVAELLTLALVCYYAYPIDNISLY